MSRRGNCHVIIWSHFAAVCVDLALEDKREEMDRRGVEGVEVSDGWRGGGAVCLRRRDGGSKSFSSSLPRLCHCPHLN